MKQAGKLSLKTLLGYGTGDFASSLAVTTNSLFLMYFATEVLRYDPRLVGLALLVGKIIDAITDPMMGEISDRTRHRWGRKRLYLLLGAVPFGLSFFILYSIPQVSSSMAQFCLFGGACILHYLCFTVCNIPYSAMTADLTEDSEERTKLTGFRFTFSILATILSAIGTMEIARGFGKPALSSSLCVGTLCEEGAGVPGTLWLFNLPTEANLAPGYSVMGAIFGVLMAVTLVITFFTTRERHNEPITTPFSLRIFVNNYLNVFANRPFRLLAIMNLLHTIAITLMGSMILYFLKYNMRMSGESDGSMVLGGMTITALIFLFPWYLLSLKLQKKWSYLAGSGWLILALLGILLVGPGDTVLLYVMIIAVGIGFSSNNLFPYAMLPDVIEVDQLESGLRREGAYYGIWVFMEKVARGTALFIAGWGLKWAGYVADQPQPPSVMTMIQVLLVILPVVCVAIGNIFLVRYPITAQYHHNILQQLQEKQQTADLKRT